MNPTLWHPSGAGIASMTQLPPSPEIKAVAHPSAQQMESLSLNEEKRPSSRLRSIARYQAFEPQALACSSPVPSTFAESNVDLIRQKSNATATRRGSSPLIQELGTSSLGAVAGAQGVAIFRVSKPHAPLLVLSHSSNSVSRGHLITSLAFQPDSSRSLYLAAARGSGVFVWDVGGHSLSPLLGRLGVDAATTESDFITSLAWKPATNAATSSPLLATTTSLSGCLWDLRFSSQTPKPCLRFGTATSSNARTRSIEASYVQVACSRAEECAILDASGTVRVFDIRMTERPRSASTSVSTFAALQHAGVGISHLSLDGEHTSWLTWGLDSPNTEAVVKIWSSAPTQTSLDGSPDRSGNSQSAYRLISKCSTPGYHLACARVCPEPVQNGIVTISLQDDVCLDSNSGNSVSWRADLWKLDLTETKSNESSGTFGLEKIVSFKEEANVSKFVSSTLGKSSGLGRLCAAELAISSHSSILPTLKNDEKDGTGKGNGDDEIDAGLVLCCLSSKGYVTTRVIPEALPRKQPVVVDINTAVSPIRQASRNTLSTQAKVYPEDKDAAVNDAARIWATRGGDRTAASRHPDGRSVSEIRNTQISLSSPPKPDPQEVQGAPSRSSVVDGGGTMLFDMDVPAVAYGSVAPSGIGGMPIGVNDLTSTKTIVASSGMGVVTEENDHDAATDIRDIAEMMENIETDRIPCPRLCGATFGPGIGGLAVFNNGDVRKMWFWYERADSNRLSAAGLPGIITEPTFSEIESTIHASSLSAKDEESTKKIRKDCPRTLQDLNDMTAAAKEAQWGERNDLDASSGDEVESTGDGDNFFEYFSECSKSSDSGTDDQPTAGFMDIAAEAKQSHGMYDNYFDNFQRPVAEPSSNGTEKTGQEDQHTPRVGDRSPESSRKHPMPSVGPSDMLAPLVRVTHDYDHLALNGQNSQLAVAFALGQWGLEEVIETNRYALDDLVNMTLGTSSGTQDMKGTWQSQSSPALPNYGHQTSSPQRPPLIQPISSDPLIINSPSHSTSSKSKLFQRIDNEPGVHGGEYSVRPNMQESMVFFRKLFSHQQEGKHTFPVLLSPPDNPFVPNSFSQYPVKSLHSLATIASPGKDKKLRQYDKREETKANFFGPGDAGRVEPGVFPFRVIKQNVSMCEQEELTKIRERCLHYARACEDLCEAEKSGVWRLLAQMVNNRLQDALHTYGCGVGGGGGGALGVDLVRNIFRYYESLRDVQMLATMVCVLSGGKRKIGQLGHNFHNSRPTLLSFLPEGQDEKYDAYIRRYSDLLYGWRLLTIRAELNKHLVQSTIPSEGEINSDPSVREETDKLHRPGLAFVFMCQQCGNEADMNTNVCRSCQDYAFRCSICENGVKGLFTVCDACGHGGHVKHITTWFEKHSECPSGCGCNCTFTPAPALKPSSAVEMDPTLRSSISDSLVVGAPLQTH